VKKDHDEDDPDKETHPSAILIMIVGDDTSALVSTSTT